MLSSIKRRLDTRLCILMKKLTFGDVTWVVRMFGLIGWSGGIVAVGMVLFFFFFCRGEEIWNIVFIARVRTGLL